MKRNDTERRIARVARDCAKVILELQAEGQRDGAARLQSVAIEAVDLMRRGQL